MRLLLILFILLPFTAFSQTLHLEMSTPQPRLGEDFTVTAVVDTIAKNVFAGLANRFVLSSYNDAGGTSSKIGVNLVAKKTGINVIGPLVLNVNGKKYLTDRLTFDVVDSLPSTNKGLWIRQVHLDDTTSYIIVEQRIPALTYLTHPDSTSISLTTKISEDEKKTEMVADSVISQRRSDEGPKFFTDPKTGQNLNYQNDFALYEIDHKKNTPVILTRENFTNLPDYYKFENIVVK